jgi:hypothetical protein
LPGVGFGVTQTPGGGAPYWPTAGLTNAKTITETERRENFFIVSLPVAAALAKKLALGLRIYTTAVPDQHFAFRHTRRRCLDPPLGVRGYFICRGAGDRKATIYDPLAADVFA